MSDNLQSTEFEQWIKIAKAMRAYENAKIELLIELTYNGNVPKSVYQPYWSNISDAHGQLKSDLETRMFQEHPVQASSELFYGEIDE